MKDAAVEEIERVALALRTRCSAYGARLILDDHVELVEKTGADGVHLGRNDMAPDRARGILGPGRIIGGTATPSPTSNGWPPAESTTSVWALSASRSPRRT